jgi:hypothetical protein
MAKNKFELLLDKLDTPDLYVILGVVKELVDIVEKLEKAVAKPATKPAVKTKAPVPEK